MNKKYYEAPSDAIFEEIKREAIKIWETYDNQFGYVDEKVNSIKGTGNVQDNAMYIVAMFDMFNIDTLLANLSEEARNFVTERIN